MKIYYILLVILSVIASSCHTVKEIVVRKDIPAITENKLLRNIDTAALDYNTLYAKRIELSLTDKKGSNSFRASLKIKRDSFIQISVNAPLGIEVARMLLTPDSVKFADIYHKKYFISDYDYFYEKFDIHIGYDCIQSLLTNTFFNFQTCIGTGKVKKYRLDRLDNAYELSSIEENALNRKIRKLYKKRRKNKDYILILQRILVDPQIFRPLYMSVEDVEEEMGVSVNYKNFRDFSGKQFPGTVWFELYSGDQKTSLEIKFLRLEFDIPVESNFKISSKYKKM